MHKAASLHLMQ